MKWSTAIIATVFATVLTRGTAFDERNWQLVPDSEGRLRLVNTNPYDLPESDQPAPLFVPQQDIIFRLFTRASPTQPQILQLNNAGSITGSNFNPAHPTRFTIHGWNNDGSHFMNSQIRDAYFQVGDFNVITVDWGVGAINPNYITARNHVGAVGNTVSQLIDQLIAATGLNPDNVYIIGYSLGAHAAGSAGKAQNGRINSIIALDPAGPLFSFGQPDAVGPADGRYVETIMTNAGVLGINTPMGQANFYPNGGRLQPGCGVDIGGSCSHDRAPQFFAESITSSTPFRAMRCVDHGQIIGGSCTSAGPDANMGGQPSNFGRGVQGVYYLQTNSASPFARG
ncbi:pancreatic triacylglycerol lipase-like [Anopheles albimanus]|uniref:Lipase domain-containing protein n=1 Tax=Anopheles albimanus TaxID=7167 RepID=A0A182FBP0_ANOAL|nr:pancreatic triacylglycerol lipase-like [Anopheles albimanus]